MFEDMRFNDTSAKCHQSGMGAYGGAARRLMQVATVLPRPPSGHRPGGRQARHVRILQKGLHLTPP